MINLHTMQTKIALVIHIYLYKSLASLRSGDPLFRISSHQSFVQCRSLPVRIQLFRIHITVCGLQEIMSSFAPIGGNFTSEDLTPESRSSAD